jgi:tRNA-splicing ligase RtcB (3'-phosphate/5'-hydroxy nucleic acid ligase)
VPEIIEEPGFTVPVRSWLPASEIEPDAMTQIAAAARHPEAAVAIAVMPDCHVGYGVTIGSVVPSMGSVIPAAVGVDIACGMCAVDTGLRFTGEQASRNFWERWAGQVREHVPTGFSSHRERQRWDGLGTTLRAGGLQHLVREKAALQLGTLGGGNHFMEAQVDDSGSIWLMVHSGSRHTGLRIAEHYTKVAERVTRQRGLGVPPLLWSLPLDDATARDYLHDMEWTTAFALESRYRMLEHMLAALRLSPDEVGGREAVINIHHNFARIERHGGRDLVVHRKGATSARAGEPGIIPGSMGSPSYIVRGLGNPESLASCSHGAGRRMGRNQARKAIDDASFRRSLAGTFSSPSRGYADEAPQAYKDIETVMARQTDLVSVIRTLRPIVTVKGDSRARED